MKEKMILCKHTKEEQENAAIYLCPLCVLRRCEILRKEIAKLKKELEEK